LLLAILGSVKQFANLMVYGISFLSFLFTQCYVGFQKYKLKKESKILNFDADESAVKWSHLNAYLALPIFLILALVAVFAPKHEDMYLSINFFILLFLFVIVPANIILQNENLKVLIGKQLIQMFDYILTLMYFLKTMLFGHLRKNVVTPI
jgi:hypothetical protein